MPDGTVIATGLNLRESLAAGTVVKVLRKSSRLEILGQETWYRVKTRDGLEGFVFADFVEKDLGSVGEPAPAQDGFSTTCVLSHFSHERFVGDAITADEDFLPFPTASRVSPRTRVFSSSSLHRRGIRALMYAAPSSHRPSAPIIWWGTRST